jgi:hypothetical protein
MPPEMAEAMKTFANNSTATTEILKKMVAADEKRTEAQATANASADQVAKSLEKLSAGINKTNENSEKLLVAMTEGNKKDANAPTPVAVVNHSAFWEKMIFLAVLVCVAFLAYLAVYSVLASATPPKAAAEVTKVESPRIQDIKKDLSGKVATPKSEPAKAVKPVDTKVDRAELNEVGKALDNKIEKFERKIDLVESKVSSVESNLNRKIDAVANRPAAITVMPAPVAIPAKEEPVEYVDLLIPAFWNSDKQWLYPRVPVPYKHGGNFTLIGSTITQDVQVFESGRYTGNSPKRELGYISYPDESTGKWNDIPKIIPHSDVFIDYARGMMCYIDGQNICSTPKHSQWFPLPSSEDKK